MTGRICAIFGCSNYGMINISKAFHRFPKDSELCKKWVILSKRADLDIILKNEGVQKLYSSYSVCSDHFRDEDYNNPANKSQGLKKQTVPSLKLPNDNSEKVTRQAPKKRKLDNKQISDSCGASKSYVESVNKGADPLVVSDPDSLSIFGDSMENIELVIEDNVDDTEDNVDDTVGTKSNPIFIQIDNLEEATVQICTTALRTFTEKDGIIDLDSPSATLDEIKEEILEVEEPRIQSLQNEETVPMSVTYEKTINIPKDCSSQNIVCYIPECVPEKEVDWFGVPVNENLKKIWDICIDRKDKRLSNQDFICHKHFGEGDIIAEVSTPDSAGPSTAYSKLKLRRGAVPCIRFHEECCVPTCRRKSGRKYCFPVLRTSDFHLWLYMIKNPALRNLKMKDVLRYRVCQLHFEIDCFEDEFSLTRSAAPTLNLPESHGIGISEQPIDRSELQYRAQQSVFMSCAYKGCKGGQSGKNLFRFPTDGKRCKAWLKACGREDLITTPTETIRRIKGERIGVCEDHFEYNQFEVSMHKLNPNAIPKTCELPNNFKELRIYVAEESQKSPDTSEILVQSAALDSGTKQQSKHWMRADRRAQKKAKPVPCAGKSC